MSNNWLKDNATGLVISVVVAVYIRFFMLPTANFFFESYHLLKVELLYIGYQVCKVVGYSMSEWEHGNIAATAVGVFVFMVYLLVKKIRSRKTPVQEAA